MMSAPAFPVALHKALSGSLELWRSVAVGKMAVGTRPEKPGTVLPLKFPIVVVVVKSKSGATFTLKSPRVHENQHGQRTWRQVPGTWGLRP
jgi:hypothetical protein